MKAIKTWIDAWVSRRAAAGPGDFAGGPAYYKRLRAAGAETQHILRNSRRADSGLREGLSCLGNICDRHRRRDVTKLAIARRARLGGALAWGLHGSLHRIAGSAPSIGHAGTPARPHGRYH